MWWVVPAMLSMPCDKVEHGNLAIGDLVVRFRSCYVDALSQMLIGYALHSAKQGFIKMTKRGTPILQSKYAKPIHLHHVQAQDRCTKARQIFQARRKPAEKELFLVRCSKKAKPSVLRRLSADKLVVSGTSRGQIVGCRLRREMAG